MARFKSIQVHYNPFCSGQGIDFLEMACCLLACGPLQVSLTLTVTGVAFGEQLCEACFMGGC